MLATISAKGTTPVKNHCRPLLPSLAALILTAPLLPAAEPAADPFMGDWQGDKVVAQVIALGGGTYRANLLPAFDKRVAPLAVLDGTLADGKLVFTGAEAVIEKDTFTGKLTDVFKLKKTVRPKTQWEHAWASPKEFARYPFSSAHSKIAKLLN